MELTEAEEIKKSYKVYTEEMCKKGLNDTDNYDGVVIHLERNNLECEVKWTLRNKVRNKASGGDQIPAELFQILKDDAVKYCTQYTPNLKNPAVATGIEMVSFHPNLKEGKCQRMFKILHNCTHFTC